MIDDFAAEGYGIYGTTIAAMDKVADAYGPVKRAVDPNNIIAPGK